jgi:hypothetical protein
MTTKICNVCNIEKDVNEYKVQYGKRMSKCLACYKEYHVKYEKSRASARIIMRRNFIQKIKSEHSCQVCEYNKCTRALDFHHLNPSEKVFDITRAISMNINFKNILIEINKCLILCCRCHREVEEGITDVTHLPTIDVTKYFEEIKIEEQKLKKYCIDCSSELSGTQTKFCRNCATKKKEKYYFSLRKVERPDKEKLSNLIDTMTIVNIGRLYGVTDNTIRKWCKKYEIDYKK